MARRTAAAAAAAAFQETLESFDLPRSEVPDPEGLGRLGALLVVADIAWKERLGPLLDGKQAQELLAVKTRQALHDLVKRRRLLAVPWGNEMRYPVFQFASTGRPHDVMPRLLQIFADADVPALMVGSWCTSEQRALDGARPSEWMARGRDPERLLDAARRSAARLAR